MICLAQVMSFLPRAAGPLAAASRCLPFAIRWPTGENRGGPQKASPNLNQSERVSGPVDPPGIAAKTEITGDR